MFSGRLRGSVYQPRRAVKPHEPSGRAVSTQVSYQEFTTMIQTRAGLVLAIVGCMAVWGCSQDAAGPAGPGDSSGKVSKLQDEVKNLNAARDSLSQELKQVRSDKERLEAENAELRQAARQRDELARLLAARTLERDNAVQHLEQIKKGVKALLEVVEPSPSPAVQPPVSNKADKTTERS